MGKSSIGCNEKKREAYYKTDIVNKYETNENEYHSCNKRAKLNQRTVYLLLV